MKVGDRITALVYNGTPTGLRVEGAIERLLDENRVVEVVSQFGFLMRLNIQENAVALAADPAASVQ